MSRFGALARPRAESATIEHLDTCSHRLDAWLLGLANRRLDQTRMTHHTGIHLGAFGWLENLRPAAAPVPAAGVPPLLDTGQPVYESTLNGGFIHTPSVDHGATAALLRSGDPAQTRAGNDLAVNISSRRVRSALALLDGIAAGNDLGALLGYQFERDLHDAGDLLSPIYLDGYIPGCGPGSRPWRESTSAPATPAWASARSWTGSVSSPPCGPRSGPRRVSRSGRCCGPTRTSDIRTVWPTTSGKPLLPSDPGAPEIIVAALDRMADTVDAVSDLVLTEGMYQIVRGNHPRAAAVLSALGEGRTPVWPEVVDTPPPATSSPTACCCS